MQDDATRKVETDERASRPVFRFPLSAALSIALVVVIVAVFGRTLSYSFLDWDDDIHVTANTWLANLSWSNVARFWREPYVFLYAPLSYTFWAAEVWLSRAIHGPTAELDPTIFHAGNVVLHILTSLTVFGLLRRLVGRTGPAFVGAAIFALHPLQVETVAWIGETRGLLSTLLGLWAVAAALRSGWRSYIIATLLMALAILAKPSAVTIPLVAMILDFGWMRRDWKTVVLRALPWLALSAACILVTKSAQRDDWISFVAPLWQRPFIAGDALAFYLRKLVLPTDLAFDYGRTPRLALESSTVYFAWLLPAALLVAALITRYRRQWLTAIGVTLAGLLPVLGLVPFLYQDISTVADRYVYLSMFGVGLGVSSWLARHWSTAMAVCWGFALGIWVMMSVEQCATWRDSYTLFGHGLEKNPQSFMSHYTLGLMAQRRGDIAEAEAHYRATLDISPHYPFALNGLGVIHAERGERDEAVRLYRQALKIRPDDADMHLNLANALTAGGHDYEAKQHLEEAMRFGRDKPRLHVELGTRLFARGHVDEAIEQYRRALELDPKDAQAHFRLGEALTSRGDNEAAAREYVAALQSTPTLAEAENNLGALRFLAGDYRQAIEHCTRALELKPSLVEARFNRGMAMILLGQRDQGIAELRETLRWVGSDSPVAQRIEQEIANASLPGP